MHQLHVHVHQHALPLRWVIKLGIELNVISLYMYHIVHAQGGRCMTISNNYFVVSISFVPHTNKINFHIIVLHSYIYDIFSVCL